MEGCLKRLTMTAVAVMLIGIPLTSFSAIRCGDYTLKGGPDGGMRINGITPESQKIIFLKARGDYEHVKLQWQLVNPNTGRRSEMDYIVREGKATLNVEASRMNMGTPRVFSTYDCVIVK